MRYSRLNVRFPVRIKKWLKKESKKEARTMTGHLLEILKREMKKVGV